MKKKKSVTPKADKHIERVSESSCEKVNEVITPEYDESVNKSDEKEANVCLQSESVNIVPKIVNANLSAPNDTLNSNSNDEVTLKSKSLNLSESQGSVESKLTKKQKKRLNAKLKAQEAKNEQNQVSKSIMQEQNAEKDDQTRNQSEELNNYDDYEPENNQVLDKSPFPDDYFNDNQGVLADFEVIDENISEDIKSSAMSQESADMVKLQTEIKELKEEKELLYKRIDECQMMNSNMSRIQKENQMLLQKKNELEKTINAMKNEITINAQKLSVSDSRFVRMNTEHNQQISYFENIRDNHKDTIEQMKRMLTEKDQVIKNFNNEKQCYKDKIAVQHQECQELENKLKNLSLTTSQLENKSKHFQGEMSKQRIAYEMLKSEKERIHETYQKNVIDYTNREKQQNYIITSLQYQIDDLNREIQTLINRDENEDMRIENQKLQSQCDKLSLQLKNSDQSIPAGFDIIEVEKLKYLTSLIESSDEKLTEKCLLLDKMTTKNDQCKQEMAQTKQDLENRISLLENVLVSNRNEFKQIKNQSQYFLSLLKGSQCNLYMLHQEIKQKDDILRKTDGILMNMEKLFTNQENDQADDEFENEFV